MIIGNGTAGPYRLGIFFIDTTTISVIRPDSGYLPSFFYIRSLNGLLFSDPIDSGIEIRVRFETDYYGLQKVYSFYQKRFFSPTDNDSAEVDSLLSGTGSLQRENLTVSGSKSVGVSIGSFGEVNLEQGLDVRIGGEIKPGTEIDAHLTDRGSSLEGNTREISNFDMIYIALSDPHYRVVAGDQYTEWPFAGIIEGRKKIKGIMAEVKPKANHHVRAFGALAGGNFTVQTWRGEGGQGPYSFTGNGEPGFITPVGGTVKLTVNGFPCEEGEDKDYVIDYDLGTFTFTPHKPIKTEDIIRAEYEYKMFDYQRTIAGATASASIKDSALTFQGVVWSEIDNKRNPIELILTEDNIRTLTSSGDRTPPDTSALPVNRNNVLDRYASIPLYIKKDTLGAVVFFHKEPDPERPIFNDSLFEVHFREADTCGDYERTLSSKYPDYVYRYVGPCRGRYTPLTPLPAPQRLTLGEVQADLKLPYIKAQVNIAGEERDRNLFSSLDDDDNLASAAAASLFIGNRQTENRSLWLGGKMNYWSKRFDREALSAFDRKTRWNDYSLIEKPEERIIWESSVGIAPLRSITTEIMYGQKRTLDKIHTDKFGNITRLNPLKQFHLDYEGSFFRHFETDKNLYGTGNLQEVAFRLLLTDKHSGRIYCRDEWRTDSEGKGGGLVEGGIRYEFLPLNLLQEVTYTEFREGSTGLLSATDTATLLLWQQKIDFKPFSGWTINGAGSWQSRRSAGPEANNKTATLLIDLNSEIGSSDKGFFSRQNYRTTAEKASRFIQIPTYVGEGKGTHRWDSTRNEYVEDLHGAGNFILRQRDVYDSTKNMRLRKSVMNINWSLKPDRKLSGIIADLWWDGVLCLEEHIDAQTDHPLSWIPGFLSLYNIYKKDIYKGKVNLCDISYRQDALWRPPFNRSMSAKVNITPKFLHIRSYRERSLSADMEMVYKKRKFDYTNGLRCFILAHDDTSEYKGADFTLRDISATFTQTHHLFQFFDIFIRERIGWARQDDEKGKSVHKPIDSTTYLQLTPGVVCFPAGRGRIEADYTFSIVNIPGNYDYRIAGGFASGISHLININADVRISKYFMLNTSYRGELFRRGNQTGRKPDNHAFSMELQAFL